MLAQHFCNRTVKTRQPVDRNLRAVSRQVGCGIGSGFSSVVALAFNRIDQGEVHVVRAHKDIK
ncbi:hypothetical protein [Mesorhizobium sp.]|uniref:hypothetical protein n=1 Tax=Mesorhizobium sp. TaxID=1871066 RepID=UPI00338ECBC1